MKCVKDTVVLNADWDSVNHKLKLTLFQKKSFLTWEVNSSGDEPSLENSWYGDEPYGDRHLSLSPYGPLAELAYAEASSTSIFSIQIRDGPQNAGSLPDDVRVTDSSQRMKMVAENHW